MLLHRDYSLAPRTLDPHPFNELPDLPLKRLVSFFSEQFTGEEPATPHTNESFMRHMTAPQLGASEASGGARLRLGETVNPDELKAGGAFALRHMIEEIADEPPVSFLALDNSTIITTYGDGGPLLLTTAAELLAFHPSPNVASLIAEPIV